MLGYLLILVHAVLTLGESVCVRAYAKKHGSGGMLMNAIIALIATLFFVITDTDGFHAPAEMRQMSVRFACVPAEKFLTQRHGAVRA